MRWWFTQVIPQNFAKLQVHLFPSLLFISSSSFFFVKMFTWDFTLRMLRYISKEKMETIHKFLASGCSIPNCSKITILEAPTPQNGETCSNNLSATADELYERVWSFCGFGALRVIMKSFQKIYRNFFFPR